MIFKKMSLPITNELYEYNNRKALIEYCNQWMKNNMPDWEIEDMFSSQNTTEHTKEGLVVNFNICKYGE